LETIDLTEEKIFLHVIKVSLVFSPCSSS